MKIPSNSATSRGLTREAWLGAQVVLSRDMQVAFETQSVLHFGLYTWLLPASRTPDVGLGLLKRPPSQAMSVFPMHRASFRKKNENDAALGLGIIESSHRSPKV